VRRLTAEGRVLVQNGRVEQAHPLLQRAVTIDVRYGESQLWLGLCEVRLGRREVSDCL
jgi:Flp pilus assembly protein TadD